MTNSVLSARCSVLTNPYFKELSAQCDASHPPYFLIDARFKGIPTAENPFFPIVIHEHGLTLGINSYDNPEREPPSYFQCANGVKTNRPAAKMHEKPLEYIVLLSEDNMNPLSLSMLALKKKRDHDTKSVHVEEDVSQARPHRHHDQVQKINSRNLACILEQLEEEVELKTSREEILTRFDEHQERQRFKQIQVKVTPKKSSASKTAKPNLGIMLLLKLFLLFIFLFQGKLKQQ